MSTYVHLKSRTGDLFTGQTEVESDGALVIRTVASHGYRSAHRDHAAKHFGTGNLWCMNRLTYVNLGGVRLVVTRWHTQTYRKGETR